MQKLSYNEIKRLSTEDAAKYFLEFEMINKRGFSKEFAKKLLEESELLIYANKYPEQFFHREAGYWVDEMTKEHDLNVKAVV